MEAGKAKRLLFLDALRGFTMLLVVLHHVTDKCSLGNTMFDLVLQTFRMPTFFFVSGFVAYKALDYWTGRNTLMRFANKFRVQVIPTVIFFSLYFYFLRDCNPVLLVYQAGWRQYWFTIVLFEYFVVYYTICYVTRRSVGLNNVVLVIAAIASILLFHTTGKEGLYSKWINLYHLLNYLPFFVAGVMVKQYENVFYRYYEHWSVLLTLTVLFLLQIPTINNSYGFPPRINNFFTIWAIRATGLAMVFGYFVHCRDRFTDNGTITRCLTYIGRRTLDIYLMHFFFIAPIPVFNSYMRHSWVGAFGYPSVVILTALVVIACLLVSALIRKWKFAGKLLFAAKY